MKVNGKKMARIHEAEGLDAQAPQERPSASSRDLQVRDRAARPVLGHGSGHGRLRQGRLVQLRAGHRLLHPRSPRMGAGSHRPGQDRRAGPGVRSNRPLWLAARSSRGPEDPSRQRAGLRLQALPFHRRRVRP